MELNILQWPSVPFAACYVSQKKFNLLSADFKRSGTGKFNWGSWARICFSGVEYIARCYPNTDLPLHEQAYASTDNLVSISNAICVKDTEYEAKSHAGVIACAAEHSSTGATCVADGDVQTPMMEPIIESAIVDCIKVTLALQSSNVHARNVIKTILVTSGAVLKQGATITVFPTPKQIFEFKVVHDGSPQDYLRISKDTNIIFSYSQNSSFKAQNVQSLACMLGISIFNEDASLMRFANHGEYKAFLWIVQAYLQVDALPVLSPSDVMSSTISGSLDNFRNWITKQESNLSEQKIVVIRDIETFRTLSPDLSRAADGPLWDALCTLLHHLKSFFSSKIHRFNSMGKISFTFLTKLVQTLCPSQNIGDADFANDKRADILDICHDLAKAFPFPKKEDISSFVVERFAEKKNLGEPHRSNMASWDDVGGYQDVKMAVEWPLLYPDAFSRLGLDPCNGILLHGPPGCSKTSLARVDLQIAYHLDCRFAMQGESEKLVRNIFKQARTSVPCILFFDELDALVGARSLGNSIDGVSGGGGGASGPSSKDVVQERILSTFLNEMDGIEPLAAGILVMVPLPDLETRKNIFQVYIQNLPVQNPVKIIMELSEHTDGWSGAQCKQVCSEAAFCALRECPDAEFLFMARLDEAEVLIR
ncbi:hypothetical protein DI09_36p10 [Mitosporidium daphniae]|uniref:AAA+ ATPase domain-containing protein n=1 Tax=Mitosporidium daphniae TaxID=1485682 RepID=A0A098VR46_9MICR|nr:uncharacterized protein DI09_36p10 [Mitosporidium daphniae]KGG51390.1 hypothetical protein DI09_36p10 [Mitosporidium daphniae]|eukprot:XP_013237834.1 uncharacterized protein DI09_36p10 [Mitosporidium daphniae]